MKKVLFFISWTLIFVVNGFSQNNLTPDQIRRHASELGVPYEALQRLVDSHRVQTGLSNPNVSGAQLMTLQEIHFMSESSMLKVGSYYRIRANYVGQDGTSVAFNDEDSHVFFRVDFLVNIPRNTAVDALLEFRADQWGGQELFLVEIVRRR